MTTADRLTLIITSTAAVGSRIAVPIEASAFKGWTFLERSEAAPAIDASGRSVRVTRIVLEPYLAGEYTVPAIVAKLSSESPGAAAETISTPTTTVTVSSSLPKGSEARDVPLPVEYVPAESRARGELVLLTGGIAAAAVCALVWWAFHQRPRTPSSIIDERALRVLTLRRMVERGDFSGISPELLSRVIAESISEHTHTGDVSGLQSLIARLDAWRFGGAKASEEELGNAARSTVRLLTHQNAVDRTEAIA